MGPRVDIGVDSQRETNRPTTAQDGDPFQFGRRFHDQGKNPTVNRRLQFGIRLADTAEDDAVRFHAQSLQAVQFASRNHVERASLIPQETQDGLVGIRLYGVADLGIQAGKNAPQEAKISADGRRAVDVTGSTRGLGNLLQIDVLAVKTAPSIPKGFQGSHGLRMVPSPQPILLEFADFPPPARPEGKPCRSAGSGGKRSVRGPYRGDS